MQESTPLAAQDDHTQREPSPVPIRAGKSHAYAPLPSSARGQDQAKLLATAQKHEPTLRYRRTPIWLLVVYLPTLIVPWVFTCVLEKHPFGHSSYTDQSGNGPTTDVNLVPVALISLLNSVNSVLTIPILSTLLAHAAVVYAMRRKPGQQLDMLQLFALADRKWSDIHALWTARERGKSSRFLWLAAALISLGAILGPLKSILVQFEQIASVSWADIPPNGPFAYVVGLDPEPADMAILDHDLVLQDVVGSLATASDLETQANLWPINPDAGDWVTAYAEPTTRREFFVYASDSDLSPDGFFVTALENGTVTGVLREHAIRLNSSIHCEYIAQTDFPTPCPGGRPLDIRIERPNVKVSLCAPGNMTEFPFTPSRNRQDVGEDLYIDFSVSPGSTSYPIQPFDNFTVHCNASTSRGYFELGNTQNDYVYGPLMDTWPDNETMARDFNDVRSVGASWASPSEHYELNLAPGGPLMTSAEALFGNYSLLHLLAENSTNMTPAQTLVAMCTRGTLPLTQLRHIVDDGSLASSCSSIDLIASDDTSFDEGDLDHMIDELVGSYFANWNKTNYAEYMLMVSMYYANRAVLVNTATSTGSLYARSIYASGGTILIKPVFRGIASMIVLTILIAAQFVGLIFLAWYIYQVPTWAPALDAAAVARIGRTMKDHELPPIGAFTEKDEQKLKKVDGLIGVVEGKEAVDRDREGDEESQIESESESSGTAALIIPLAPGATGFISKKLLPRKSKKSKKNNRN
ncbi:hypothetical protein E8E14_014819 [Neopestalotiopsis sp. 37M]|nr:hypothetical protein E8E14_014819 [Neopestalotiopsis sp. 37M]